MNVDLLVAAIVVLPAGDWLAVLVMWLVGRGRRIAALRERLRTAFVCSIAATVGAVLGWAYLTHNRLGPDVTLLALCAIVILPSLPSLAWLVQFAMGRFEDEA